MSKPHLNSVKLCGYPPPQHCSIQRLAIPVPSTAGAGDLTAVAFVGKGALNSMCSPMRRLGITGTTKAGCMGGAGFGGGDAMGCARQGIGIPLIDQKLIMSEFHCYVNKIFSGGPSAREEGKPNSPAHWGRKGQAQPSS